MRKMRVELAKSRDDAARQAQVLSQLGFRVDFEDSFEVVWVNEANDGTLVTYSDPGDKEVWVVVGRK